MGVVPNEGRAEGMYQVRVSTCNFDFLFLDLVLIHFSFHFLGFDRGGTLDLTRRFS
jgi:hypothetical protein